MFSDKTTNSPIALRIIVHHCARYKTAIMDNMEDLRLNLFEFSFCSRDLLRTVG